ncbi:MAG: YigZ family protein [Firmicutes bacterium]|nr:YigZ family protein [Bacillota bacterium]
MRQLTGGMSTPTVFSSSAAELIVERSRFVAKTFHLPDPEALETCLTAMKDDWPQAHHYTWAYRIGPSQQRAFDDGEPHQTAGLPMLNLLVRQDWTETLVIVARYFGGIKLGRGGLVRAYQAACQKGLDATVKARLATIRHITLQIPYRHYDRAVQWLAPVAISWHEAFGDLVTIELSIEYDKWLRLEPRLNASGEWTLIRQHDEPGRIPLDS